MNKFYHWVLLIGGFSVSASVYGDADQYISEVEYIEQLQNAKVWEPVNTPEFDIVKDIPGPRELQSTRDANGNIIKPVIECRFREPKAAKVGGKSAKFNCDSMTPIKGKTGKKLKVKYDPIYLLPSGSPLLPPQGYNGEVYSEVAATRLLTALGFKADHMFPATVICFNCPAEPFSYITKPELRKTMQRVEKLVIESAAIEIKAAGEELGTPIYDAVGKVVKDEFDEDVYRKIGWGLDEVRTGVGASTDGEQQLYREALVALLGILQHADNKASNQRLLCTDWDKRTDFCHESYLVAQDVGSLFGKGVDVVGDVLLGRRPSMSKYDWSQWNSVPVWKNADRCELKVNTIPFVNLTSHFAENNTFEIKQISVEARDFLLSLLDQLSDQQLLDLFLLAQTDLRMESYRSNLFSPLQTVTADHWVSTFKRKRDELATASCRNGRSK
ncbi:MAG: hypothetical protein ACOH5I_06505 [Oligoflexus sp.]